MSWVRIDFYLPSTLDRRQRKPTIRKWFFFMTRLSTLIRVWNFTLLRRSESDLSEKIHDGRWKTNIIWKVWLSKMNWGWLEVELEPGQRSGLNWLARTMRIIRQEESGDRHLSTNTYRSWRLEIENKNQKFLTFRISSLNELILLFLAV